MRPKHWLSVIKAITSNWTVSHPNQAANKNSTEMCILGGMPRTAAMKTSLHFEPPGGPLHRNCSFHSSDKQQLPESLSPPLSKFTWGLGAAENVSNRGQSKLIKTCNTQGIKTLFLSTLKGKLLKCMKAPIQRKIHTKTHCLPKCPFCVQYAHTYKHDYFHFVIDTLYGNEI